MEELIKIDFKNQTISARDLYEELSQADGLKGTERFSKWFERFCNYGFTQGIDYSTPNKKVRVQIEGSREVLREVEDYELSVDMSKQICMLQRTEKGRKIRQYLIDLEKAWNTPEQIMARALRLADETINNLRIENEEMKPKALFADAVATSHTSILIGDLAKLIKQNGIDIGQQRLFAWMRDRGYLIKSGTSYNMPTQKSMEAKLFEVKESTVSNPDGSVRVTRTTKVTGKGQQYFVNKFLAVAN